MKNMAQMRRNRHLFSALVVGILLASLPSFALAGPNEHYPYWEWGPDWGKSDIYWDYSINRPYADTETYWSSSPRLTHMERSTLWVNTYEHEIWFYNYCDSYGGCGYAVGAEGFWTTLPGYTYLDTALDDPYGEPHPTIGTSDADDLNAQTYYMMDFVLTPRNPPSTWSRVKIREVRGSRPVGYWWEWYVHEVDGMPVVPYSQGYSAPGYIHWHY